MGLRHAIAVETLRRYVREQMDEWTAGDISHVLNWGHTGWVRLEEIPGRIAVKRLETYKPKTSLSEREVLKILTPPAELVQSALGFLIYNGTLEVRTDANPDHEQIGWDPAIWIRSHPEHAAYAQDLIRKMMDPKWKSPPRNGPV